MARQKGPDGDGSHDTRASGVGYRALNDRRHACLSGHEVVAPDPFDYLNGHGAIRSWLL